MLYHLSAKPILARIGLLMSAIVVLAIISMLSSVFIAQTTDGMATAINQSGSLRMQSYRISVALADDSLPPYQRAASAASLALEFESRLASPRLVNAIPGHRDDQVNAAYTRVRKLWHSAMKPPLERHIELLSEEAAKVSGTITRASYLAGVDTFVEQIDGLVGLLEAVAESRIDTLRLIQAVSLILTVAIVWVTMVLVNRRVITPLGELLDCADRARQGDFSGHTRFSGDDELGRLGAAMNRMARDLSRIYGDLEQRVSEQTQDLKRSNHSLDLLYRTSQTLSKASLSERPLRRVLEDIQTQLAVGPAALCLRDPDLSPRNSRIITADAATELDFCWDQGCRACESTDRVTRFKLPRDADEQITMISFPVRDHNESFGVLRIELPADSTLESWQERLLMTLAGHIGTALNLQHRMREGRRLTLHEERGIIARELHDSLAQSLSYLKIQAARLSAALKAPAPANPPEVIVDELKAGITSAYRQLRELLTTFRIKMDDRGLNRALEETVDEFRQRGTVMITLDNRLPTALLTPNEEIHVLQIIREALSNVVRHAGAANASVSLGAPGDFIEALIEDDGRGIRDANERAHHYGMSIMRERILSLGGEISLSTRPGGGTRVRLSFRHRAAAQPQL